MGVLYVDASAVVKLVLDEPESGHLRAYLDGADLVSCELLLTEVPRAIWRAAARDDDLPVDVLRSRAEQAIDSIALASLDRGLLRSAGSLTEPGLRALDAIHVAAAVGLLPLE
ncbi:MAG TPA: type II toxin-antitoxin system VapC family toxin, partial [Candidatus Deferrimicrobium sp.]|nr:type II toxin-antitoxin system VapC family toxin [Candidatus Deferrimicrobium sp.]